MRQPYFNAYASARRVPPKSIPSLAFKNSPIWIGERCSAFCIRMCIPWQHAYSIPPILKIILYWNQVSFQDHLGLEYSERNERYCMQLYYWTRPAE
jgi:hypothetical protein